MFGDFWKTCPDFPKFVCTMTGEVRRKDGKEFPLYYTVSNKSNRRYKSLRASNRGVVHRQVFKAWGPPNPDTDRYDRIDHTDNDPLNNNVENLRWSNPSLNALNTSDRFKGWTLDNSRTHPYKAQMKWMGQTGSIGYFKTAAEARARYMECKEWLQQAYRENVYPDKALVWAFRMKKHREAIHPSKVGTPEYKRTKTQMKRILGNYNRFLAKLG